jgi:predicted MPP superfamily phosphohydrolase
MINILHISDIHFGWNKPEEDGVVLDAFFDDLKNTMQKNKGDENYCIISGDLVFKGCDEHEYQQFYSQFIGKLIQIIPLNNIMVVAGNHDLNRKWVENNIEKHKEDIYKKRTEVEFNDYMKEEDCQLLKKFIPFNRFCKEIMCSPEFDITGYYRNITSDISIFMLNSALCSSGGAEDIVDEGHLAIETRKLNDWISQNKEKTKVLVMHHPIAHLKENYQDEITSMCKNGIDYVFAGHLHNQNVYQIDNGAKVFISPQLFSRKADVNGYSIIRFDYGFLIEIVYKEWNKRHRKFMDGQSFTGTSGGKWVNGINENVMPIDKGLECLDTNSFVKDYPEESSSSEGDMVFEKSITIAEDPNIIPVSISDSAPIIVLFGARSSGKTMTLVRLTRWLRANGYNVRPDRVFRPDVFYAKMCDSFDSVVYSNYAASSNQVLDFILVNVTGRYGEKICQILDAPGEHYFDEKSPDKEFPVYINKICTVNNPKIWMFFVENNWKNRSDRESYVIKNNQMRSVIEPSDSVIFICPKADKQQRLLESGHPNIPQFFMNIENQYPGLFNNYKKKNPIARLLRKYNFDFVVFSAGLFNETVDGKQSYVQSNDKYPAALWRSIMKTVKSRR